MTDKTVEEIEEMRKERGIKQQNLSVLSGASGRAWSQAVRRNSISDRFKRNAIRVIEYYDEYGILPLPGEVRLEPLGRSGRIDPKGVES